MGKTRRKNGEGNGRSCDKDNPHNRGWRKRLDREYHKGNRTKLKGEVTGNIKNSSNTKIRDYKVKCKCNNEDIVDENHKSHRTLDIGIHLKKYKIQYQPLKISVIIKTRV